MGNRTSPRRRGIDPSAHIRALRLEQLFREELNSIFDGELGDERLFGLRVTLVELARDGSRARIWYGMNDNNNFARVEQAHSALHHAAPYLRSRLSDALPLKRTPELSFKHDPAVTLEPSDPTTD
jgi:ribosome-binding factor A